MMTSILLGAGVFVSAAAGCLLMRRRGGRAPAGRLVQVFRCPRCGQQLRYPAEHAGREVPCPVCWKRCTLPVQDASAAYRPWRVRPYADGVRAARR